VRARYKKIRLPDRPRATGVVYEHILIAERALGKPLPPKAEVHHVNGDKQDNRPENLVICPDAAYHKLLEARTRRLNMWGRLDIKQCLDCLTVFPLTEFYKNARMWDRKDDRCKSCRCLRSLRDREACLIRKRTPSSIPDEGGRPSRDGPGTLPG
jgi:hypothetical protein